LTEPVGPPTEKLIGMGVAIAGIIVLSLGARRAAATAGATAQTAPVEVRR